MCGIVCFLKINSGMTNEEILKEFDEKFLPQQDRVPYYVEYEEAKAFIISELNRQKGEIEEKRYRVEGMSALIKFIRNKARLDIMKADEYGQGYYQAIKDMEDYFSISEVDNLKPKYLSKEEEASSSS